MRRLEPFKRRLHGLDVVGWDHALPSGPLYDAHHPPIIDLQHVHNPVVLDKTRFIIVSSIVVIDSTVHSSLQQTADTAPWIIAAPQ